MKMIEIFVQQKKGKSRSELIFDHTDNSKHSEESLNIYFEGF